MEVPRGGGSASAPKQTSATGGGQPSPASAQSSAASSATSSTSARPSSTAAPAGSSPKLGRAASTSSPGPTSAGSSQGSSTSSSTSTQVSSSTGGKKTAGSSAPAPSAQTGSSSTAASERAKPKSASGVFAGCEIFINPALDTGKQEEYRKLVRENGGGIQYYFDASKTTHVVTADLADLGDLEAARQAKIHLVTPLWLQNSARFGELEDGEFYSPDPKKFFSGLCVCTSKVNAQDRDMMLAGVVALGGRISRKLNDRCTHLIMQGSGHGSKYQWARAHNVKVVSVSWYNESVTRRKLEPEDKHPVTASSQATIKSQQPTAKSLSQGWTPVEDDEESDEAQQGSVKAVEFNLMFGRPNKSDNRDKKGKSHEDDLMSEEEKDAEGKVIDDDDEDEEEEEEDIQGLGKGEGSGEDDIVDNMFAESIARLVEGAEKAEAEMSVAALTRAAQIEEEIKTYIRNNAQNISARELRLKFKMGHPRAKRLLKEVMFEIQKETKQAKKRKANDGQTDDTQPKKKERVIQLETEEKTGKSEKSEKEEPKDEKKDKVIKPDKVVTAAEKNTLMKDLHILLVDLPESRHQDARDAINDMGGISYRYTSENGQIEGITWSKEALPPFTHILYQENKPAIEALKKKLAQYGITDVQEVSIEWVQWCDLHLRLFTPEISPLFQPLPSQPVPGMDKLIISQSNTRGWEREEIVSLINKLGAKYNRSMPNEPNVLLVIVPLPKGSAKSEKEVMAKQWNVPVVSKEWLYACARKWQRVSTDDFVIKDDDTKEAESAKPATKEKKGKKNKQGEDQKPKKGKRKAEDVDIEGTTEKKGNGDNEQDMEEDENQEGKKKEPVKKRASAPGVKQCVQCGATKTPCWRKGADGERNLCNACGLKYSTHLRRRQNRLGGRKPKKNHDDLDFGRFGDDDDDDDDEDKKRGRRTFNSSGYVIPKKRSSDVPVYDPTRPPKRQRGSDEDKETTYIVDEQADDPDQMQKKVQALLASEGDKPRYHFAFSCIPKSQQTKFKRIVTKLGGTYSDVWEPGLSTHLILGILRRTEKMLCACASGSWILRPSYLTKCDEKGRFAREERHEWFEEEWDDAQEKRIWGGCMRRHRLNHLETGKRPFEDWELNLLGDTEPMPEIMARIIEAGGGKCISTRSLVKFKKQKEHRYVLVGQNAEKKAIKRVKELGIPCLESLYMANYLCGRTPPSIDEYQV